MPNTLFHRLPFLSLAEANSFEQRGERPGGSWLIGCNCEGCDAERFGWLSSYNPSMARDAEQYLSQNRARVPALNPDLPPMRYELDESGYIRPTPTSYDETNYETDQGGVPVSDSSPYRIYQSAPNLADIFDTATDQNGNLQPNASMPRTSSFTTSLREAAARLSATVEQIAAPAVASVPVAERTPEKTITRLHSFRQQCETVLDGKQKRRDPDYRILVETIWDTGNPERVKLQWVQTPRCGIVDDCNRDTFCFVNPLTGDIFTPAGYSRRCSATPSANVYDTISAQRITTNGIALA